MVKMSIQTGTLPLHSNPRQKSTSIWKKCACIFSIFKSALVLFVLAVFGWGYYVFVIDLCIYATESLSLKIFFLIGFHIIFALAVTSYLRTVFTSPGKIPAEFDLTLNEGTPGGDFPSFIENLVITRRLPVYCRVNSSYPICLKCNIIKPDRTHHCSMCRRCILKMDHHCPWVNNCVSFTNYKFFILFLGYTCLLTLYTSLSTINIFVQFFSSNMNDFKHYSIMFLFFVSFMFGFSIFFLLIYHIYLIFKNRSTLESNFSPIFIGGPVKDAFHIGKYNNFLQVFGTVKWKWFLPIQSSLGDGVRYPMNPSIFPPTNYEDSDRTNTAITTSAVAQNASTINTRPFYNSIGATTFQSANSDNQKVEYLNNSMIESV